MMLMKKFFNVEDNKTLYREYIELAWPSALEGLFINLIILTDLFMVGKLGIEAVAAVGIVSQPKMILLILGKAIGIAVTAITARRKGEKNIEAANRCMKQALLFDVILYFFLTLLVLKFNRHILLFAGAKDSYIDLAVSYYHYIVIGIFFRAIGMIISSAKIGVGDTKTVFYANFAGNIVNVIFNYLLIFGKFHFPRLEMAGAGMATMMGNIINFIILLYSVMNNEEGLSLRGRDGWRLEKNTMRPLFDIGSSGLMEQCFERLGMFLFARMVAELGDVATGTHHLCMIVCDLYYYIGLGLGVASSSITGQKLGEKRPDLAKVFSQIGHKIAFFLSGIVAILFITLRYPIFRLLIKDAEVIELGAKIMILVAISAFPQAQAQVSSGILRGAGDNRYVAMYSLLVITIFRPILTYLLTFTLDFKLYGVWMALVADQSLRMLCSRKRIKSEKWIEKEI